MIPYTRQNIILIIMNVDILSKYNSPLNIRDFKFLLGGMLLKYIFDLGNLWKVILGKFNLKGI